MQAVDIALLGTFHFDDRMLEPSAQEDILELVTCLQAFAPTKIVLEVRLEHLPALNAAYHDFINTNSPLSSNEIAQVGFRLAQRLGHSELYGMDAWGRYYELDLEHYATGRSTAELDALLTEELAFDPLKKLHAEAQANEHHLFTKNEENIRNYQENYRRTQGESLKDYLARLNSSQARRDNHAGYISSLFQVGAGTSYAGVDYSTRWFNRNLRIFANIVNIARQADDRMLVIIGTDHVPILRHCLENHPAFNLCDIGAYL